jgi:ABC-type protease/lipase transport system fused ATPase/permease subunit
MWNVMDLALTARSMSTMMSLLIIVIGAYVFWSSLEWIRSRLMTRLSLRIDWDLSADIFDASFRRHVMRKNVDVQQQLKDLATLRQFLTGDGALTLIDAPFAIVYITVAWIFSPWIALFVLGSIILMATITYLTSKATSPILKVASDANTEASRVALSSLRHAESSLALGMMPAVRQKWYTHHHRYLENQVNASEASGVASGMSGFFSKSMASLQMGISTMLAIEGLITGGMVMAANLLIQKAVTPINSLTANWAAMVETRLAYERLNALLMSDEKRNNQMQLPAVIGSLTVSKAAGVPPGSNKAVLFDIDFQMKPGQVVAVVGPSAAGKTCLARMLIGVWKPARGSVRLDGVEISEWDHDEFGPQIGYVPQEIEFFDGTVAENIARLG